MEKIAIIGSPGAGKTTLAKDLERVLKIKVYHLDRLLWQPGWIRKDRETRIDTMQSLAQEKQWIIEGTYLYSSIPRLDKADTIIFLDISPLVCLWHVIKRYHKDHGHSRRDIPEGSKEKLTVLRLLKVLSFPLQGRKTLMQKLHTYESKEIIWLRSNKEVEGFLEEYLRQYAMVNDKREKSSAAV